MLVTVVKDVECSTRSAYNLVCLEDVHLWVNTIIVGLVPHKVARKELGRTTERILDETSECWVDKLIAILLQLNEDGS